MTYHIGEIKKLVSMSLLVGSILAVSATDVFAQENSATNRTLVKPEAKSGGRDPFRKYEPPKTAERRTGEVTPPSIQERIAHYRAQKLAAMKARTHAPKPTTALLLSELQVVGISRTPRGYAAIVEATPIKLSYVIYPGEKFYDGQLVAVEDNRLVFRKETVFSDGRRDLSVEMKSLRQPNSVDVMSTASATVPSSSSVEKSSTQKSTVTNQP